MTKNSSGPGSPATAPFIHSKESVPGIYWKTCLMLVPVAAAAAFWFGARTFELLAVTVSASVLGEVAGRRIFRSATSLYDGHSVLMGVLLALMLPPSLPAWMAALGGFFSSFLAKEIFGGLGQSPFHPALAGNAFWTASFPVSRSHYVAPGGAEMLLPLTAEKFGVSQTESLTHFFWGGHAGALGETSAVIILVAGALMIWQRLVFWEVPVLFLLTLYGVSLAAGRDPSIDVYSGSAVFMAVFILSDPSSTPHSRSGMRLFAVTAALLTLLIRIFSVYSDGASFAVLLAGISVPWLDQITRPKGARVLLQQEKHS